MVSFKIFLQLMVTVFRENLTLATPYILQFTLLYILCLYMKQYLFQNKLRRTGLKPR